MGRKRNKGKWAAAAISAPKEHNTLALSKIISEHIDDAARIRWAELPGLVTY
jgi:hypothetical protein